MKLKKAFILIALIASLTLILGSCFQFQLNGPLSVYTEEPDASQEKPDKASPTPPVNSSIKYLEDASEVRPVYDGKDRPVYDIQVVFDEDTHTATASQTVKYFNTFADSIDELFMHIYPNHFSKPEYAGLTWTNPDEPVYPDDEFNPGYIKITSVMASGEPCEFQVQGADETILKIPLSSPLMKGSSIELGLEYSIKVPNRMGRYAWGESGTSVANWYPIMAVYDSDGWNLDEYYEMGDPFYSETADYTITIDMPEGLKAAYTGDVVSDTTAGGRRVLSLRETGVRDFAFALSRDYVIESGDVDGIKVSVAVPFEDGELADEVLEYAEDSLTLFNRLFGRYTNDTLTVAFTDSYGGMEYPGLVFVSAQLLEDDYESMFKVEEIVAHEIAHQWWYSAVGNDEIDEAWLDEGLASFSEMAYYGESVGWRELEGYWTERDENSKLDKSVPAFSDWDDYIYVYRFGQSFFKKLMDILGREQFYGVLQQYYADYAYEIATAQDLRAIIEKTGSAEALEWFDISVYGE